MHKWMNALKISLLVCVLAVTAAAMLPGTSNADIIGACWDPGGDACTVTDSESCGPGCTITIEQNYQNWIIIFF